MDLTGHYWQGKTASYCTSTTCTSPTLVVLLFVHTNKIFIITWPLNRNNLSDLIDLIYHPYFLQHHYHRITKQENNSVHCTSCLYLTIYYFIISYLHSTARITNCTRDCKWGNMLRKSYWFSY